MIRRGGVHWVELGAPVGSRLAKHRPVVVVQSAPYNVSRLATVVAAVVRVQAGAEQERAGAHPAHSQPGQLVERGPSGCVEDVDGAVDRGNQRGDSGWIAQAGHEHAVRAGPAYDSARSPPHPTSSSDR